MFKSNSLYDPMDRYLNEKEAFKFMIDLLSSEPPRVIKRCSQELEFFYNTFRNKSGLVDTKSIKICDVIGLSYIKIKYPFLIDFFLKTIHMPLDKTGVGWYLFTERFEGKDKYLTDWITELTGRELNDFEKMRVTELVGLVAHKYLRLNHKNYNFESKERVLQRTSEWITLYNAITLVSDNIENQFEKYYDLFQEHKKNASILSKLNSKQILEYSRFFIDIESSTQKQHIDIAEELLRRLESGKLKIKPISLDDSYYQEAVYQFVYQILSAIEKDKSKDSPSKKLDQIFSMIQSFLKSEKLTIKAKYIFLNSFANNERGGGSEIHFKLTHVFDNVLMKYYNDKLLNLINEVFNDANKRYFKGRKILYKFEENFFYVLYQSWTGKIDIKEIAMIRKAAKRALKSYPEAIRLYWSRYPYDPDWETFDDIVKHHTFMNFDKNYELYMPLKDLIKITKEAKLDDKELFDKILFWENMIKKDPKRYKNVFKLQEDLSTLKAVMIKRDFYKLPHLRSS